MATVTQPAAAGAPALDWKGSPIRKTMFEILECCNTNFRPLYVHVAKDVIRLAREHGLTHIVELGAGTAPMTKALAEDPDATGLQLTACDLVPDVEAYHELERRYPGRVTAITTPVDYSQPHDWGPSALLLLVGTFPGVPAEIRPRVLAALTQSSKLVMVYEPLRKSAFSILMSICSLVPGLALPLVWINRPGRLRRFLWCWIVPAAPLLYMLDGLRWCLRCLTSAEWRRALAPELGGSRTLSIESGPNSQVVIW